MNRSPASGPDRPPRHAPVAWLVCLAAAGGCVARTAPPSAPATAASAPASLVIGEFALADDAVIDGDTIRVVGLERSLRLVGFDAEETFKNEADRSAAAADWPAYVAAKTSASAKPVKFASPAGEAAKEFARQFFHGVTRVRLERDHPRQLLDVYDRLLAYVFVERGGEWLNYNVECVRAGWAPYFMKYGYSLRFHDAFEAAMAEARAAGRGIWSAEVQHYPDYDRRLAWWRARAEVVRTFLDTAAREPRHVLLSDSDALERLHQSIGQEVNLLGAVGTIVSDRLPVRVYLTRRRGEDVPLIFAAREVFAGLKLEEQAGEYVQVRGAPSLYRNPKSGREQLQIVVDHPGQVTTFSALPR